MGNDFSWVDKETGEPCPTDGTALCTLARRSKDHRHVAAHMWKPKEPKFLTGPIDMSAVIISPTGPCGNCGASQTDRAMIYKGEPYCSDNCRKILGLDGK